MVTALSVSGAVSPPGRDSDDLELYEVVDGKRLAKSSTTARNSVLAAYLLQLMGPFARSNQLGRVVSEALFMIDRSRMLMRRPDLAFVSDRRWSLRWPVPPTEEWNVIPDLAIEFIGRSHTAISVMVRIEEYFQAGVRAVWVIYPVVSKVYVYDSPTRVHILQLGDELDGGNIKPGFRVALSTLFKEGDEEPEPSKLIEGQQSANY
jgi:Uma2 family endonuclease